MDVPMNVKPPMNMDEMAAVGNNRIRRPQPLCEIPQAPGKRQPAAGAGTVPQQAAVNARTAQPRHTGRSAQTVQPGRPQNRAPATQMLPGIKPGMEMRKGQKASLSQKNPNLREIRVCMGWRTHSAACDVDASAFLLGEDNRALGEDWFVFYGQTQSPDGSVVHSGDSRQDAGAGDAETLEIHLNRVDPRVRKIVFIITIDQALQLGLNFSMLSDTYIRVVDAATNSEIVRFVLQEYYSNVTSMVVGEIYKRNGEWKFNAVGNGVARDLAGLCGMYGIQAAY